MSTINYTQTPSWQLYLAARKQMEEAKERYYQIETQVFDENKDELIGELALAGDTYEKSMDAECRAFIRAMENAVVEKQELLGAADYYDLPMAA